MEKKWKDVIGYKGLYIVNDAGEIMSLDKIIKRKDGVSYKKKGRILKQTYTGDGYYSVLLVKNGKQKRMYVHRIVAKAFIPNPENHKEINHINEDKKDNRVSNLEWIDHFSNCNYGTRNKRISKTLIDYNRKLAKTA